MTKAEKPESPRLEIEFAPAMKSRVEYAASLRGMSVAEFVIWSAKRAANQAIQEDELRQRKERARAASSRGWLSAGRPDPNAVARAKTYKKTPH